MPDIKQLDKTFTPQEPAGLDTLDDRFQSIVALVEAGEFVKAADATQGLLAENILDIRTVAYFLYGCFSASGLGDLKDEFGALARLLTENWPAVGPTNKKDKHSETAVAWFLTRLADRLESIQKDGQGAGSPEWTKWTEKVDAPIAQATLDTLDKVKDAIKTALPNSQKAQDSVKGVEAWLKTYVSAIATKAPEAPPPPPPEEAPPPEPELAAGGPAKGAVATVAVPAGAVVVEGSHHMDELQQKLRAFETLCKKKDFGRASVVASDISAIVEKFDPRLYFPKLFASFYMLSMHHLEKIAPELEKKETPGWKAMEQLYKVDLDTFSK